MNDSETTPARMQSQDNLLKILIKLQDSKDELCKGEGLLSICATQHKVNDGD